MNTEARTASRPVWDFFCSLNLAMSLLLTLAVTCIIGTVIPQGNVPQQYLESISPAKLKLYTTLGFFDMYHSWWFVLLLGGFSVNLIACSLKRLPQVWKSISNPQTLLTPGLEKSLPNTFTLASPGGTAAVKEKMVRILSRELGAPLVTEENGTVHLYCEKGAWCRLAVYMVHLSILVIFAGAIVGSLAGFKGMVNIPEGESVSSFAGRGGRNVDLGFSVRCDKFSAAFYDTGAPKEFKSLLTVLENGKPVAGYDHVPVIVNDPLSYKGVTFYQSSYGKLGEHEFTASDPDGSHPVPVHVSSEGAVQLPDGSEMHVLEATEDVSQFEPGHSGAAAHVEIHSPNGATRRMAVYAGHPELNLQAARQNGGPLLIYRGGNERMYTGLQVARDPGVLIVWFGCGLMVVGIYAAFFMSHRRVWARIEEGEVVIGGNASKNPAGFQLAFERLQARISAEFSTGEGK